MARDGYKIFDTDTHVGPYMNVLEAYLTDSEKAKLPAWEQYRSANKIGNIIYNKGQRHYKRRLGNAGVVDDSGRYMAGYTGAKREREPSKLVDVDPAERIKDLDFEGVDVNLMLPSGWFGTWTTGDDVQLEMGMYRAYHRWMNDYCGAHPDRLGGVLVACARDVKGSVEEIRRWSKSKWAWGVLAYAPFGMPLDHPDLEPIWAEAQEHDLAVTLHTFTVMPPYAPGGLDTWDNLFVQRSAAHPWCGMRNMAALLGSGIMDRYPRIRVGTLEAGHGWLPFWMKRLDEHAETIKAGLPELKDTLSGYVTGGRYFQSIEIPEGEQLTEAVIDIVGEGVLMYASDYPHGESHFPHSVETVLGWNMAQARKRTLFWDNAVKFYARSGHR